MDFNDMLRPLDAPDDSELIELAEVPVAPDDVMTTDIRVGPQWAKWWPKNLDGVEWAVGVLNKAEAEKAEIKRRAKERQEMIKAWEASELARIDASTSYLNRVVTLWGVLFRKANPKRKSVKFPGGGVLTTTHSSERVEITDENVLVQWLLEAKAFDALTMKPKISMVGGNIVKGAVCTADGEIIPGVGIRGETVTVGWKFTAVETPADDELDEAA